MNLDEPPPREIRAVASAQLSGVHPKFVVTDELGREWLFKPASLAQMLVDVAAAKIAARAVPSPVVYPRAFRLQDQTYAGSIQPYLMSRTARSELSRTLEELTDPQREELQRHHVVDWLLANPDAHRAQFLILSSMIEFNYVTQWKAREGGTFELSGVLGAGPHGVGGYFPNDTEEQAEFDQIARRWRRVSNAEAPLDWLRAIARTGNGITEEYGEVRVVVARSLGPALRAAYEQTLQEYGPQIRLYGPPVTEGVEDLGDTLSHLFPDDRPRSLKRDPAAHR